MRLHLYRPAFLLLVACCFGCSKSGPEKVGGEDAGLPPAELTAPSGLSAEVSPPDTVVLTWTAGSGETGLSVQRGPFGGELTAIASLEPGATTYTDETAAPDGHYGYRVVASDAAGKEAATATHEVWMPPPGPTALAAQPVWSDRVSLTWVDEATTESGYQVRRRAVGTQSWTTLATLSADATGYTDAVTGGPFDYAVVATSTHGDSAVSAVANVVLPDTTPQALTATEVGSTHVTLSWTDGALETGLRVERSDAGGAFSVLATLPADAVTFTDDTTVPEGQYAYRVIAFNGLGDESATPSLDVASSKVQCGELVSSSASPAASSSGLIAPDTRFAATFADTVVPAGPTTFVITGSQSGPHLLDGAYTGGYPGDSLRTVTSPMGHFLPGETVEVTLTRGIACKPRVVRYRVATGEASGPFKALWSATGDNTSVYWTGDLNGDGRPDAVGDKGFLWGEDGGTFVPGSPRSIGNLVRVADVNEDGRPDVLDSFFHSPNIEVLIGEADGGYTASAIPVPSTVLAFLADFSVGDIDLDGHQDVWALLQSSSPQKQYLGQGDGGFVGQPAFGGGTIPSYQETRLADLNEDGYLDLVYDLIDGDMNGDAALLSSGDGGYETNQFLAPVFYYGKQIADLDGDGHQDLIGFGPFPAGPTSVFYGDGDGGITETVTLAAIGDYKTHGAVMDMDGDGDLDVVTGLGNGSVTVSLSNPSTRSFTPTDPVWVGPGHTLGGVGDFDGDGHPDVLVSSQGAVTVLPSDGTGHFLSLSDLPGLPPAENLAVGDLDHDGDLDVVFTDQADSSLTVVKGDGTGRLTESAAGPVTVANPTSLVLGDVNADGDLDALVLSLDGLQICLGDGEGELAPPDHTIDFGMSTTMTAGDLDGDGFLDLMGASSKSVSVLLGDGQGGFVPGETLALTTYGFPFVVGDLDADGDLDAALPSASGFVLLWNDGGGHFTPELVNAGPVFSILLGDVNEDGRMDIVATAGSGLLLVFQNDGAGGFSLVSGNTASAGWTALGDWNGDGHLDVVALSDRLRVLKGDGSGVFTELSTSEFPHRGPPYLALGDIDGDGRLDAVVSSGAYGEPGSGRITAFRARP